MDGFEDRFCASKKNWVGRGGQVSAWGTIHMAAALAGCRMALVVSDCKDKGNTKLKPYLPKERRLCLNVHGHLT